MDFELTEGVFSQAVLKETTSVSLWLGANVMLEYSLDEAHDILSKNFNNCESQLETIKKELALIRDSVTILEAREHGSGGERAEQSDGSNIAHFSAPPDSVFCRRASPQVSIARVYNYDVSRRRSLKQKAGGEGAEEQAAV